MGMACANDGGGYEVLYRWCQLNIAEWGGLIGSVKEGKFLDEIWGGGGGMGGGGGTKLKHGGSYLSTFPKVVFELFQKLHLQIYASQFMTS